MKWVGPRTELKRRFVGQLKDDQPSGDAFVEECFLPGRAVIVAENLPGAKKTRSNPVFNPPAGDVRERDIEAERFQIKRHFVWCSVYQAEIGNYKESDAVWRDMPGYGWKRGLYVKWDPTKEGRHGWVTVLHEKGKELQPSLDRRSILLWAGYPSMILTRPRVLGSS